MTSSVFSPVYHNLDKAKVKFGFIYIFENNVISHSRELDMMKKINQDNSRVWFVLLSNNILFFFFFHSTTPYLSCLSQLVAGELTRTIDGRRIMLLIVMRKN